MATIPIGDVLEERPFTRADARTFIADPGPGNPNIRGNGFGSREAAAFQSPPNSGPPRPQGLRAAGSLPTGPQGPIPGAQRFGQTLGSALRPLARIAPIAKISDFNSYKINDPDVDSSAAGTFNALRRGDFSGAGRSLSKGALETGMDLLSGAAGGVDLFLPGTPVSDRLRTGLRNQFGDQLIDNSQQSIGERFLPNTAPPRPIPTPVQTPVAPNPTNARLAAGTAAPPTGGGGGAGGDNVVTRRGNAFSGTNIREGFTYADGAPGGGGTLTVLPGGPTIPGAGEPAAPVNDQLAGAGGSTGFNTGLGGSASAERFNRESLQDSLRQLAAGRGQGGVQLRGQIGAQQQAAAQRALEGFDQNATGERIAALREAGDSARATLRDRTDRRGQDLGAQVALSGQGVTLRGQDINARTAAAAARSDQANKDRQYQLDVAKFGKDQADTRFTQRQSGEKAFNDKLNNLFVTTDANGKSVPDTAKVADFQTAVSQTLAARIDRARASGDPKLVAKAEELASRGVSALDDTDLAELRSKFLLRERAQGVRGFGPFSGSSAQSSNLDDFGATGIKRGVLQDRVQFPAGSVGVNDLKYTEPSNAILPNILKQPTREFDFALRGLRQ